MGGSVLFSLSMKGLLQGPVLLQGLVRYCESGVFLNDIQLVCKSATNIESLYTSCNYW